SLAGLTGGGGLSLALLDGSGDTLALPTGGATNLAATIANFEPRTDGTYYIEVTGNPGVKYDLVVTRDLAFDTENNNSLAQAQDITATVGPIAGGGALGAIASNGSVALGTSFDGLHFTDTSCGCLPPDNGFAVGDGFAVEAVNTAIRISDLAGTNFLTEELTTFFGIASGGDPQVVFD